MFDQDGGSLLASVVLTALMAVNARDHPLVITPSLPCVSS